MKFLQKISKWAGKLAFTLIFTNSSIWDLKVLFSFSESRKSPEDLADESLKQAAVKIQATYRGFRTRKSIQMSATAATKIQAHFRGYKVRKNLKRSSSLNDLRNSASSSCSNLSGQQDLEKHVTKIQAGVRGYLVRKRHSLQNVAAAKIQMNYRKYKSRKESKTKN